MNHQVLPLYVALVIIMVLSPTGAKCNELELHIGKFSAGNKFIQIIDIRFMVFAIMVF